MSLQGSVVPLRDRITGELVDAILIDGINEDQLRDVEANWLPVMRQGIESLKAMGTPRKEWPQSHHWNWRTKGEYVHGILAYRGFAIECQQQTQGLMLVTTAEAARLPEQKGKPIVYIDYLETAPWNQRGFVRQPRFNGIGTVMLAVAITLSLEEGFSGRIGLHSLPQSEKFYEACGMTKAESDPSKQGLLYFEMTSKQATAFLGK